MFFKCRCISLLIKHLQTSFYLKFEASIVYNHVYLLLFFSFLAFAGVGRITQRLVDTGKVAPSYVAFGNRHFSTGGTEVSATTSKVSCCVEPS